MQLRVSQSLVSDVESSRIAQMFQSHQGANQALIFPGLFVYQFSESLKRLGTFASAQSSGGCIDYPIALVVKEAEIQVGVLRVSRHPQEVDCGGAIPGLLVSDHS